MKSQNIFFFKINCEYFFKDNNVGMQIRISKFVKLDLKSLIFIKFF